MTPWFKSLLFWAFCLGGLTPAFAMGGSAGGEEPRFALVIGNAAYPASIGKLENTKKDARIVSDALKQAGFSVDMRTDLDKSGMEAAVDDFLADLESNPGAVGFFYYSGHGTSASLSGQGRVNLLIPVRAESERAIESRSQLIRGAVRLDNVIDALAETGAKAVFVASDACRDEFAFSETKGPDKGFDVIPSRPGMLIAFATAAGATAPDDGRFSKALAAEITAPGKKARYAIFDALAAVAKERSTRDQPFAAPGLIPDDVCFSGCAADAAPPPQQQIAALPEQKAQKQAPAPAIDPREQAVFDAAEGPCEFEAFAEAFPDSPLNVLAKARAQGCGADQAEAEPAPKPKPPAAVAASSGEGYLAGGPLPKSRPSTDPECPGMSEKSCTPELVETMKSAARNLLSGSYGGPRETFEAYCRKGFPDFCYGVGVLHQNGFGAPFDQAKAAKLYKSACDAGVPDACADYGYLHQMGMGVSVNKSKALSLYRDACNNRSGSGCSYIAVMHMTGDTLALDPMQARNYLDKSCNYQMADSCYALANLAASAQNVPETQRYLRKTCDIGIGLSVAQACQELSVINSMNSGLPTFPY